MKKGLFTTVLLFMITLCFSSCQKTETFKVLQFNIWQEGTVVENGFDAVADEIVRSDADFVTTTHVSATVSLKLSKNADKHIIPSTRKIPDY